MSSTRNAKRATLLFLVVILIPLMTSCGGSSQSTQPPPPTAQTAIQLKIGDAAADRLLSFTLRLERLTATTGSGTVEMITTPLTLEITHTAGTMEILRTLKVPQGTYTRLSFAVSGIRAQAWEPTSGTFQDYTSAGLLSGELPLDPPISIGSNGGILNMDLNLQSSISFDNSGAMMVTPNFEVTWSGIGATDEQNAKTGRADNLLGVITSINGPRFTMSLGNSSSVTMATDYATAGEPLTSLAMGAIVRVDAETQSDGSLRAKRLDFVETGSVVLVEGLVTATIPPTTPPGTGCMGSGCDSAVIRVNEVWAPPLQVAPAVGDELTLTGLVSATYKLDAEQLDTWSTGAVSFSNATLGPGARVQALVASGTGSVVAYKVWLAETTAVGTVQDYNPGPNTRGFTLRIASDSMMQNVTRLMPQGYLSVWDQSEGKTVFDGFPSGTMQNGMQVRVRGLAFWEAPPGYLPGGPHIIPTQIDYVDYLSTP